MSILGATMGDTRSLDYSSDISFHLFGDQNLL